MDELTQGDDIIDRYWPFDGPHDDHTTRQAVAALAHLTRYLANATGPGHHRSALPYAATGNVVVGNLASMAGRLTQVLDQTAEFFEAQAGDPTLYDDRRHGPDPMRAPITANMAVAYLLDARSVAAQLEIFLRTAQGHTGHLGNDAPPTTGEGGQVLGSPVVADMDRQDREGL